MSSISSTTSSSLDQLLQQRLAKLDTNNDGTISKAEFVAGRPSNVSEAQAGALYDKIDTTGSGAVTESQLADGMKKAHHGHHHKPADATDSTDSDSDSDSDDDSLSALTNGGLASTVVAKLLQMIQDISTSGTTSDSTDSASNGTGTSTAQQTTASAAPANATATAANSPDALIEQLLKSIETGAGATTTNTAS